MMSNEFYLLLVVIILFSSIQSILGIGLLLFGTPLLLIIGYSYVELLWILLPSSCSLSLYQIFENHRLIKSKKEIFYYTIPALILSLIIVLNFFIPLGAKFPSIKTNSGLIGNLSIALFIDSNAA